MKLRLIMLFSICFIASSLSAAMAGKHIGTFARRILAPHARHTYPAHIHTITNNSSTTTTNLPLALVLRQSSSRFIEAAKDLEKAYLTATEDLTATINKPDAFATYYASGDWSADAANRAAATDRIDFANKLNAIDDYRAAFELFYDVRHANLKAGLAATQFNNTYFDALHAVEKARENFNLRSSQK